MTTWLWVRSRRRELFRTAWVRAQSRSLTSLPPGERFNILFFGSDEFSCSVLKQLHAAKDVWQSITLVTHPDHRTGRRGSRLSISPLKLVGHELSLATCTIPLVKSEFKAWVPPAPFVVSPDEPSPDPSHLLVTASFGRILRKRHLEPFSPGRRLNVHPSLLPHYRGPAPIQHALLNGETETGVCIIEMLKKTDGAIDSGDIWGCEKSQIADETTFGQLRDSLGKQGGDLLASVLRRMSRFELEAKPQEFQEGLKMAPMIAAAKGFVDPRLQTADQIVRIYRALEKPVIVRFYRPDSSQDTGGTLLQLHQPEVLSVRSGPVNRNTDPLPSGQQTTRTTETAEMTAKTQRPPVGFGIYDRKGTDSLIIGCRDETYLRIRSVKQENRALLNAQAWWNGLNAGTNRPIRVSGLT